MRRGLRPFVGCRLFAAMTRRAINSMLRSTGNRSSRFLAVVLLVAQKLIEEAVTE